MSAQSEIEEIVELVPELAGAQSVIELAGGLTNTNYKVEAEGRAYVGRGPARDRPSERVRELARRGGGRSGRARRRLPPGAGNKVTRARLCGLMSKYGWTLWASIQDSVSDIDFDFWSWGMEKYERAVTEFESSEFERLLEDVRRED